MTERPGEASQINFGDDGAPRSAENRARWHEGRRERAVAGVLLELYLMAAAGVVPAAERTITLIEARGREEAPGRVDDQSPQPVRCVPRRLIIGVRAPQELLRNSLPGRADFLEVLFAKVSSLPASFGEVDSLCERAGLVQGFHLACLSALASGRAAGGGRLRYDRVAVSLREAFEHYKAAAKSSFQTCADQLDKKLTFPKPLPHNERRWKEQFLIVEQYAAELRRSTAVEDVARPREIEELIRIYGS